jgi:HK97 family phage prohead protease
MTMKLETRFVSLFDAAAAAELRMMEGQPNRLIGVIPYGKLSADLGGFRERITPTAFRSTLAAGKDVRALVDHASDKLLGRTSNGTLVARDTPAGLEIELSLPDTSYARDVRELVQRRDVRGLSFGFRVLSKAGHRVIKEGGETIRELLDVDLREVSVVGNPAYGDTSVALRSGEIDPALAAEIAAAANSSFPRLAKSRLALLTTLMKG